ncbi:11338_t:CDS:2 [Ambispora gerdemannii]|uniref:11338_t:CDS:1 n=1 Tax=Ambispora gerdemannii TaxID=144530 RepID=A0A9N9ABB6_9GLOM|nr:11338_t:CDS:2 [Ambispora gerdemannii]
MKNTRANNNNRLSNSPIAPSFQSQATTPSTPNSITNLGMATSNSDDGIGGQRASVLNSPAAQKGRVISLVNRSTPTNKQLVLPSRSQKFTIKPHNPEKLNGIFSSSPKNTREMDSTSDKGSPFSSSGTARSQTPSSDIQQSLQHDKCLHCYSNNYISQDDREDVVSLCWCTDDEEMMEQQEISKTDCSSVQKEINMTGLQDLGSKRDIFSSREVSIDSNKTREVTGQAPVSHIELNRKRKSEGKVALSLEKSSSPIENTVNNVKIPQKHQYTSIVKKSVEFITKEDESLQSNPDDMNLDSNNGNIANPRSPSITNRRESVESPIFAARNTMVPPYNSQIEVNQNSNTVSFDEDQPLIETHQRRAASLFKHKKESTPDKKVAKRRETPSIVNNAKPTKRSDLNDLINEVRAKSGKTLKLPDGRTAENLIEDFIAENAQIVATIKDNRNKVPPNASTHNTSKRRGRPPGTKNCEKKEITKDKPINKKYTTPSAGRKQKIQCQSATVDVTENESFTIGRRGTNAIEQIPSPNKNQIIRHPQVGGKSLPPPPVFNEETDDSSTDESQYSTEEEDEKDEIEENSRETSQKEGNNEFFEEAIQVVENNELSMVECIEISSDEEKEAEAMTMTAYEVNNWYNANTELIEIDNKDQTHAGIPKLSALATTLAALLGVNMTIDHTTTPENSQNQPAIIDDEVAMVIDEASVANINPNQNDQFSAFSIQNSSLRFGDILNIDKENNNFLPQNPSINHFIWDQSQKNSLHFPAQQPVVQQSSNLDQYFTNDFKSDNTPFVADDNQQMRGIDFRFYESNNNFKQ